MGASTSAGHVELTPDWYRQIEPTINTSALDYVQHVASREFSGFCTARGGPMASRISSRRWLLRDIPLTSVLFVWVSFGFSILIYFIDWSSARRDVVGGPQMNLANDENSILPLSLSFPRMEIFTGNACSTIAPEKCGIKATRLAARLALGRTVRSKAWAQRAYAQSATHFSIEATNRGLEGGNMSRRLLT
jgi:hypothetical protein